MSDIKDKIKFTSSEVNLTFEELDNAKGFSCRWLTITAWFINGTRTRTMVEGIKGDFGFKYPLHILYEAIEALEV